MNPLLFPPQLLNEPLNNVRNFKYQWEQAFVVGTHLRNYLANNGMNFDALLKSRVLYTTHHDYFLGHVSKNPPEFSGIGRWFSSLFKDDPLFKGEFDVSLELRFQHGMGNIYIYGSSPLFPELRDLVNTFSKKVKDESGYSSRVTYVSLPNIIKFSSCDLIR